MDSVSTEAFPIKVTTKAVDVAKKALSRRGTPDAYLRVAVKGGGCSGVSYVIEFSDKKRDKDLEMEFEGLKVLSDPKSMIYLNGSVLDYQTTLMEQGFKFQNPNEKKACGCGQSFGI